MNQREALTVIRMVRLLLREAERARNREKRKKKASTRTTFWPGYGYRWGQNGREPDAGEQATIARIAEMRGSGMSFYRIAAQLMVDRVMTAAGREWSPARVRRAYLATHSRRSLENAK